MNFKQLTLVSLQFLSAAMLVLTSSREVFGSPASVLLMLTGAVLGIWSWLTIGLGNLSVVPRLREDASLVTSGPYRVIRHPMYVAVLLFCGGFLFHPLSWWRWGTWFVLLIVVGMKSQIEERFLMERFAEYANYRERTGGFIPRLTILGLRKGDNS